MVFKINSIIKSLISIAKIGGSFMFEKRDRKIIFALLAFIIFLSWSNAAKMTELQNRFNQLQSEISSMRWQVSEIEGTFSDMREQERWWAPAQIQVEKISKDEVVIKVEWQLKEYQEDSKVTFNYRDGNTGEFKKIDAEQNSNGYFTVSLQINPPREPIIYLHVSQARTKSSNGPVLVEEKAAYEELMSELAYEYYISVETQGTIRNSDILNLDLWEITYSLFSPVDVNINIMKDGSINGMVHGGFSEKTHYKVAEMYLETRDSNNNTQERWYLEKDAFQEMPDGFSTIDVTPEKDYHSLYLVIEYNEGLTVEKRISF